MAARPTLSERQSLLPSLAPPPLFLTPLVGRRTEVDHVSRLLATARLVTLLGAGGSGKTRLAAAVAESVHPRVRHGVAWIDLAPLADPALVAEHVAAALGIREEAPGSAVHLLIARIGSGSPLLVVDNCEHLLPGAALLVDALLRGCPALRILATSRQRLGLPGEKAWLVPTLEVDGPAGENGSLPAAVQLFVERAGDLAPSFALTEANRPWVDRICRRVGGLPLAIELAAARIRLLPPEQLSHRLDARLDLLSSDLRTTLPRHRTLRALTDWSHDLLSGEERCLFARLAVFSGGFTLDAAEALAGDERLPPDRVLDLLAALVDRSLVASSEWHGEARFTLPETIREYAWEKLREAGEEEALRHRHARYFTELAEAAEPHIVGGTRGTPWMTRLEQEHGNLRAAMEWCHGAGGQEESTLRLHSALHWFHFALGRFHDPRMRIQEALDRAPALSPRVRGRALAAQGYCAFWSGDHGAAAAPLAGSVRLLEGAGTPTDLAFALTGLGTVSGLGGDPVAAQGLFDAAGNALGDPGQWSRGDFHRTLLYAFASYWRGTVALSAGNLPVARAAYEESVRVAREWGSHPSIAHPLSALARVLVALGELDRAESCLTQAMPILTTTFDPWGLVQALQAGALLAAARGRPVSAVRLVGAADAVRTSVAASPPPHEAAERVALLAAAGEVLPPGSVSTALDEGAALAPDAYLTEIVEGGSGGAGEGHEGPGDLAPPPPAAPLPDPTPGAAGVGDGPAPQLRVLALGPLQIFTGPTPLQGEAFGSSKPRELLLLLLSHPGGLTREEVGLQFWPDAAPGQVKNSFHVTLHRLRKALEHPEWVIMEGDRYRLDPTLQVEFDATRFQREVPEALADVARGATEAEDRLTAALTPYRGDFLAGEPVGDWHLDVRDRLRALYADGLLALGTLRMDEGRLRDAEEAFVAILSHDRLHEEACRRLMICRVRDGRRVDALRLFETFSLLFQAELEIAPDPRTLALRDRIVAGEIP